MNFLELWIVGKTEKGRAFQCFSQVNRRLDSGSSISGDEDMVKITGRLNTTITSERQRNVNCRIVFRKSETTTIVIKKRRPSSCSAVST